MSATPRGGSAVSASSFPPSGFFSHHGPWAPGVRLFRQLGFRSKALIVSTCFVVPLAVVSTSWFSNEMADLDFTRREADGTRFLRQAWWIAVFPGIAIMLTVLALNLVGEGLNDGLNARLDGRTR